MARLLVPTSRQNGKGEQDKRTRKGSPMLNKPLLSALLGACLLSAPVAAQQIDSAYTKIDLAKCTPYESYELGQSWACDGYKGLPVFVAEDDLRMFVSYGVNAPDEMAAHQTLPAFNTINETLEWRLVRQSGRWEPFATILRFFTQSGDGSEPDGQILVVTKLAEGNTCHIAYIDARLTRDANVLARHFADTLAPVFDCEIDDPAVVPD